MLNLPLKIAITDCRDFATYSRWLGESRQSEPAAESLPAELEIIRLFYRRGNSESVAECAGLVLTSGEAINPAMYGRPEWIDLIEPRQIDDYRDLFEVQVLERALAYQIPILAIGRGMQLMNVFLGGSLRFGLADGGFDTQNPLGRPVDRSLTSNGLVPIPTVIHRGSESKRVEHEIEVTAGTLLEEVLASVLRQRRCLVSSDHHHAIDRISPELIASASTVDGVVETLEWSSAEPSAPLPDPLAHPDTVKPWMLALQWNPERMEPPISKLVRDRFIGACEKRAERMRTAPVRA